MPENNQMEEGIPNYGLSSQNTSPITKSGAPSILYSKALNFGLPAFTPPPGFGHTPEPTTAPEQTGDFGDSFDKLATEGLATISSQSRDPYKYQKSYSYNPEASGAQSNQNFQRYYQHSDYNKLGFNPWKDNETNYNESGSATGDLTRAVKSGAKLFYTGFVSPLRSYASAFSGNPLQLDYQSAKEMEQLNTIGSSSRGGVAGFTSNLLTNAGYSLGIAAEVGTEAFLAGLLAPETGGASIAAEASRIPATIKGAYNAFKGFNVSTKTAEALNALKNFDTAKVAYGALKGTAEFVNPLENTFAALKNAKNISGLAMAAKTAGGFYTDLRLANLVASEAKMEGASVSSDLQQQLLDEYYSKYGKPAEGDAYRKIITTAAEAGNKAMYANLPAIYLTDKITFDGLFKPFKKLDGTYTKTRQLLEFSKKEGFSVVEPGITSTFKAALKPKTYGRAAVNYLKGNLSEGLQESIQDVISESAKSYYEDLYNGHNKNGLDYVMANVGKQFSGKGFETFASGFLMGGLIGITGAGLHATNVAKLRLQDKLQGTNRYQDYLTQKKLYAQQDVARLNELYKDPIKYFGSGILRSLNTTNAHENKAGAEVDNDNKHWQDMDDQEVWGHITTALETNTYDRFIDHLDDIASMDNDALKETYNVDGQQFKDRLGKIKERAESIKKSYDEWNNKAPNPFNPKAFVKKEMNAEDKQRYNTEALAYVAWERAKQFAIFYNHSFDRNKERINSLVNSITQNTPVEGLTMNELSPLYDTRKLADEQRLLKQEIKGLRGIQDPSAKADLKDKQERLELLKNYDAALKLHFAGESLEKSTGEKIKSEPILKEAYDSYMKHLAKKGRVSYSQKLVDESFSKVRDIHRLGLDNMSLMGVVNHLDSPQNFYEYHDRLNKSLTDLYNKRDFYIQESIKKAQDKVEMNALISGLMDKGIVIGAKDLEALAEKGTIPTEFFDVAAKQVINQSSPRYEVYKQAVQDLLAVSNAQQARKEEAEKKAAEDRQKALGKTPAGKIYFGRHGKNSDDLQDQISGVDAPGLAEEGKKEIEKEVDKLGGVTIHTVVTSDTTRAVDSAEMIAKDKGAELIKDPRLNAWDIGNKTTGFAETPDADWEKMSKWFALNPTAKIYSGNDVDEEGVKLADKYAGRQLVESFDEFKDRILAAIPDIVEKSPDNTFIVTHSNILNLLQAYRDNGEVDNEALNELFTKTDTLDNGEFTTLQRKDFAAKKPAAEVTKEKPVEKYDLKKHLDEVKNGEDLVRLETKLQGMLVNTDQAKAIGLYDEDVAGAIEAKKAELASKLSFDDIHVGNILLMNDTRYGKMKVIEKSKNQIKLRKFGKETGAILVVSKNRLSQEVKYKYSEAMPEEAEQILTNEEISNSNQSVENIKDFTEDDEALAAAEKAAETKTSDELKNDLLNILGCK